jgi:aerobic carbon-monoxide dehydrogenase small subunit
LELRCGALAGSAWRQDTNMSAAEKITVRIRVNGEPKEALVEPRTLLVDFLRENLNLTGTHIGCDTTYCGACTVLLNGRTVKSCTLFAPMADGGEISTVEGLSTNGALHPVQNAFAECHGLQCGYCTPGLLLSTVHLLNKVAKPTEKQIRKAIAGNTCRCTGYQNILKAIRMAAGEMS